MKKFAKFGAGLACALCVGVAMVMFAACGGGAANPTRECTRLGVTYEPRTEEDDAKIYDVNLYWMSPTDRAYEKIDTATEMGIKGFYGFMIRYKKDGGEWVGKLDVTPAEQTLTELSKALPLRQTQGGTNYGDFILYSQRYTDLEAGRYTFEIRALYVDFLATFSGATTTLERMSFEYGPTATKIADIPAAQ
jgi:hypothetical protein